MRLSKQILLSLYIIATMAVSNQAFTQCDEVSNNYSNYLLKRSFNLDPIEGVWKAFRTVKIYERKQLKRIKKEYVAEQWIVTKQEEQYIICTDYKENGKINQYFTKSGTNKYIFNKHYLYQSTTASAYATLLNHKLKFSFTENENYLKTILGANYSSNIHIEYEYELEKEMNYATKVSEQIPKIKSFIIESILNYFNR